MYSKHVTNKESQALIDDALKEQRPERVVRLGGACFLYLFIVFEWFFVFCVGVSVLCFFGLLSFGPVICFYLWPSCREDLYSKLLTFHFFALLI